MTDRKLKRLLAEKPFLIDDNFSMTGGEAELMLMENSPLSIEDMLVKVRQKDGWKPEFEQMIKRILANTPIARWNRLRVNLQTGLQHTWAFHAKAVVTWVIILLLTAVMVFTPVGKAVADRLYQIIIERIGGQIIARNETFYTDDIAISEDHKTISKPEDSTSFPVVMINGMKPDSMKTNKAENGMIIIRSNYPINNEIMCTVVQYIFSRNTAWSSVSGDKTIEGEDELIMSNSGLEIYLSQFDDGIYVLNGYSDNYTFQVQIFSDKKQAIEIAKRLTLSCRDDDTILQ